MVRLRRRRLGCAQTVILGVLLGQLALLPVLPRVALAFVPVPPPAAAPPAPDAPPAASPPPQGAPAQPGDVPPPYPAAGSPPPGYPPPAYPPAYPPATNTAPGYPPANAAPPAYPPATYPPPAYRRPPRHQGYDFDGAQAAAAGERDAIADTSSGAWFVLGCLLGGIGVLIAYVAEPTPPPSRLIGQSPEWVSVYSAAYKSAGRSAQGKSAIVGCLVITAVIVVLIAASAGSMPQ